MSDWSSVWPAVIAAVSGLAGVGVGAYFTSQRDREDRRARFLEAQLDEFYAPLVGMRREIRTKSELRVRVHDAANTAWAARVEGKDLATVRHIEEKYWPEFDAVLRYSNEQLAEELLSLYRRMVALFRRKAGLAEDSTRAHCETLVEFVEIWNRRIRHSMPADVAEALGHAEANVTSLYEDLEFHLASIRERLRAGG